MTRIYHFGLAAILFIVAFVSHREVVAGQVSMRFEAIKDVGIYGFEGNATDPTEQLQSGGDAGAVRALKSNQQVMLMDFDTTAMASFLQANPGTATWTLNIQPFDNVTTASDVEVLTVESTNDWAEGDGQGFDNLGWTTDTASATYFYAQTFHSLGVLDTANSLEWDDPDSGPYTFTTRVPNYIDAGVPDTVGGGDATSADNPTPAFTNSNVFTPQDLLDSEASAVHASVVLDAPIVDTLLNDGNNRGLRFGPLVNAEFSNWRVFDRENDFDIDGELKSQAEWIGPYLEVKIVASIPSGDFDGSGVVDAADYTVWLDNLGATEDGSILNGNGNGGIVDAVDYGIWKSKFGNSGTGNSETSATVAGVPEPSTTLLATSAFLLLGRRRMRRQA